MADSRSATHTAQNQNEYLPIKSYTCLALCHHSSTAARALNESHTRSGHCAGAIETSIRSIVLPSKRYRRCPRGKGPGSLPLEDLLNVRRIPISSLATAVMTTPVVAVCTSRVHQHRVPNTTILWLAHRWRRSALRPYHARLCGRRI